MIERHILFNNYMLALNDVNNELEMIIRHENFERCNNFFQSKDKLLQEASNLKEIFKYSELWRRNIDLNNMANSFSREANSAVLLMTDGYNTAAIPVYNEARHLFNLTNTYYYNSYDKLLSKLDEERENIDIYRSRLNIASISLIIGLFVISAFLAQSFAKKITKPISNLTDFVSNAAISEDRVNIIDVKDNKIVEVEALARAYNIFSRRINAQFYKLKKNVELGKRLHEEETKNLKVQNLLKASELKALQSRINPHFMFNSLNMINNVAFLEGAAQTTDLLEALGSYLRYNYDKFNKVVTIKDEMDNVNDYFQIQKIRMGDRLKYELISDENTKDALIPCLIIQPLVENSIVHGVGKYIDNAFIKVKVQLIESRVHISIFDNGIGITDKSLTILNSLCKKEELVDDDNTGIGIRNVISRLKIFYNNKIHFEFNSIPGEFTEINIDLPYRKETNSGL